MGENKDYQRGVFICLFYMFVFLSCTNVMVCGVLPWFIVTWLHLIWFFFFFWCFFIVLWLIVMLFFVTILRVFFHFVVFIFIFLCVCFSCSFYIWLYFVLFFILLLIMFCFYWFTQFKMGRYYFVLQEKRRNKTRVCYRRVCLTMCAQCFVAFFEQPSCLISVERY